MSSPASAVPAAPIIDQLGSEVQRLQGEQKQSKEEWEREKFWLMCQAAGKGGGAGGGDASVERLRKVCLLNAWLLPELCSQVQCSRLCG